MRNYKENPLKRGELVPQEELYDYYINQNKDLKETASYFNCSRAIIRRDLKFYNIKKSRKLIAEVNKRNCLEKYGVDNVAKVKEFALKNQQTHKNNLKVPKEKEKTIIGTWRDYKKYPLKTRELIPEDDLYELYMVQNLSAEEISKLLNVSKARVNNCVEKYEYKKDKEQKRKVKERLCLEKYGKSYYFQTKECKEKFKKTCLDKYGVENPLQNKQIKEKMKKTCLDKYGAENPIKSDICKEKSKQTCLEKYGVESHNSAQICKDKQRQTMQEKYGVDNISQLPSIQERKDITKRKNNSYNKSKEEEYIYNKLTQKFKNVKRQYKDDRYPFNCDFYIPELDLFIEFQGFISHGKHPFNLNNPKDIQVLNLWQKRQNEINYKGNKKEQYKNYIHVWTKTDPLKRKTAKENNLNWLEFFSLEEFNEWFEKQ